MKKMVIQDPAQFKRIIRDRRLTGAHRFDEVWNGVYVMSPDPDNDHQRLVGNLVAVLRDSVGWDRSIQILGGGNVSDRDDWTKNYRVPDVLVFLPGNTAEDRGTHYYGGPDFAVEIISPRDRSRKKFKFYAKVGVRELLLVNRKPWCLELYRLHDGALELVGTSDTGRPDVLPSSVLPVAFRLLTGEPRPQLEVTRTGDGTVRLA